MPNKNYVAGRRKEYKICNDLKADGFDIAQRSAGSHSPIDVFAIHKLDKKIIFVQSKPDSFPKSEAKKINDELGYLKGKFEVEFWLL